VKRSRGRGRRPQNNGGGGGGGGHNHNPNRTFDSSGPEIKIRGSAAHVYEKYLQLARDANSAGDRVLAENYLQHAEHYFRVMSAVQAQQQQFQAQQQINGGGRQPQIGGNGEQPITNGGGGSAPSFSLTDPGDMDDDGEGLGPE